MRMSRNGSRSPAKPASGSVLNLPRMIHFQKPSSQLSGSCAEIALQNVPVDRRERDEIGGRDVLVGLVHLLAEEAELDHRAIILDETRVRGAAGGRQCWRQPSHFRDRI